MAGGTGCGWFYAWFGRCVSRAGGGYRETVSEG